jgi:hypothetical protein
MNLEGLLVALTDRRVDVSVAVKSDDKIIRECLKIIRRYCDLRKQCAIRDSNPEPAE